MLFFFSVRPLSFYPVSRFRRKKPAASRILIGKDAKPVDLVDDFELRSEYN
jgi:hypothetical protein